MIIRKATAQDAWGIAEVHVQSWKTAYKGIISDHYLSGLKVEDRLKLWKNSLSSPKDDAPVFVAVKDDGNIVGFASFGIEREKNIKNEGELYAIYLLNDSKGKKLGTQLFYAGVQELIKHNFKSVRVWVLAENPSINFYEKFEPMKDEIKSIQIGGASYEEIAYKWEQINDLLNKLENQLKA
jgi:L-amino acid N-acyltransferase YncA